ncbi:MAG: DNA mismatch repair protein MutS, partial [Alphaproteobacteria bacterium]|nr:DNA mismatch repair protein MutS [Alphaproteobacteria bacterium]
GRTLAEAHALLARFLVRAAADGTRTVLVITGHGARRDGGSALRRELPHWLNAPDLRPLVLALVPAAPQDGGAGAFYVLLKRRRAPTG